MAFIRSRANLLTQRCHSSLSYILHHRRDHDHRDDSTHYAPFSQHKSAFGTTTAFTSVPRCFHFSVSPTFQASFSRQMSTSTGEVEMMGEVAIVAADSVFPIAQLQYFIHAVHSYTGFNWWISIALTTLLARLAVLPLMINFQKAELQVIPQLAANRL